MTEIATLSPIRNENENAKNTLSSFLQALVDNGVISEKIAFILNQLESAREQNEALNKLREKIPKIAQETVNEIQRRTIIGNNQKDTLAEIKRKPSPRFFRYLTIVTILIISILIISYKKIIYHTDKIKPVTLASKSDQTAVETQYPYSLDENKKQVDLNKKDILLKSEKEIKDNEEIKSSVPHNLSYRTINENLVRLRWNAEGKNLKFHIYSATKRDMSNIQREDNSSTNKPYFDIDRSKNKNPYWVVTSFVEGGSQSIPSKTLRIRD